MVYCFPTNAASYRHEWWVGHFAWPKWEVTERTPGPSAQLWAKHFAFVVKRTEGLSSVLPSHKAVPDPPLLRC